MYDILKTFSPSQYRSRFKIWKLKKPRKPREPCSTNGREVTTHSLAARLVQLEEISLVLSVDAEHSELQHVRDEDWQYVDDVSFYETLEEIERDPEFGPYCGF